MIYKKFRASQLTFWLVENIFYYLPHMNLVNSKNIHIIHCIDLSLFLEIWCLKVTNLCQNMEKWCSVVMVVVVDLNVFKKSNKSFARHLHHY